MMWVVSKILITEAGLHRKGRNVCYRHWENTYCVITLGKEERIPALKGLAVLLRRAQIALNMCRNVSALDLDVWAHTANGCGIFAPFSLHKM